MCMLKPSLPVPQKVTIFGDRTFNAIIRLNVVIWVGLNSTNFSLKEREFGHTKETSVMCTNREKAM